MHKQLPFGLRSALFLFQTCQGTTLDYYCHMPYLIHYLDDFLPISPTQTACLYAKNTIVTLFTNLGIPLSWKKEHCLTFPGIQLDTFRWQLRLLEDKLNNLLSLLMPRRNAQNASYCLWLDISPLLQKPSLLEDLSLMANWWLLH